MMSAVIGCPGGGSAKTTQFTHFSAGSSLILRRGNDDDDDADAAVESFFNLITRNIGSKRFVTAFKKN
uniref:CSON012897 protein n=1 Tax=Culicoides sonorensis TaxID=179676 RepID=A0A336MAJ4_CULSO